MISRWLVSQLTHPNTLRSSPSAETEVNCTEFVRCSDKGLKDLSTKSSFSTSSRSIFRRFSKGVSAAGSGEGGSQSSACEFIVSFAAHFELQQMSFYLTGKSQVLEKFSATFSKADDPFLVMSSNHLLLSNVQGIKDIETQIHQNVHRAWSRNTFQAFWIF